MMMLFQLGDDVDDNKMNMSKKQRVGILLLVINGVIG
jgi:hypothetical protein